MREFQIKPNIIGIDKEEVKVKRIELPARVKRLSMALDMMVEEYRRALERALARLGPAGEEYIDEYLKRISAVQEEVLKADEIKRKAVLERLEEPVGPIEEEKGKKKRGGENS